MEGGYLALGMDHFAKEEDEIARAYKRRGLQRNFQGYSLKLAEDMIGLGVTSIGFVRDTYAQNLKELDDYYQAIDRGMFPVCKGLQLSEDDKIRKWVIHTLMCKFALRADDFQEMWSYSFFDYFETELEKLGQMSEDFVTVDSEGISISPLGELFVRNIVCHFDAYYQKAAQKRFSKAV